jgi:uncharacterized SAM-binding protein YcdF (DUF218 family)
MAAAACSCFVTDAAGNQLVRRSNRHGGLRDRVAAGADDLLRPDRLSPKRGCGGGIWSPGLCRRNLLAGAGRPGSDGLRTVPPGQSQPTAFFGGPGDGAIHEPEAMRRLARRLGVPDSAILLDSNGLNTDATVRNTVALQTEAGFTRLLVVSHGYHLPRVKMAYRRTGLEVYTVPARETRPLTQMPYLMAREVAAVWAYFLKIN